MLMASLRWIKSNITLSYMITTRNMANPKATPNSNPYRFSPLMYMARHENLGLILDTFAVNNFVIVVYMCNVQILHTKMDWNALSMSNMSQHKLSNLMNLIIVYTVFSINVMNFLTSLFVSNFTRTIIPTYISSINYLQILVRIFSDTAHAVQSIKVLSKTNGIGGTNYNI